MRRSHRESASAYQALCAIDRTPEALSRRRFLQGAMAGAGAAMVLPSILADGVSAAGLGPTDNILVVITMAGGNDSLNTVVPRADGTYYDLRGPLAIPADQTLNLGGGYGLHPELTYLRQRWNQGNLALVQGIGNTADDHSHFSSLAQWMTGLDSPTASTGWLGRYLDGRPDSLAGVAVGDGGVPLAVRGTNSTAVAMPTRGNLFGTDTALFETILYDALHRLPAANLGLGPLGYDIAEAQSSSMTTANIVQPVYSPELSGDGLVSDMTLAARLINLNVGVQVVSVSFSGFDTHDDQPDPHAARLRELDDAIRVFYANLAGALRMRTTVMAFSEFGRRAARNDSNGTDHGSAGTLLLVGDRVAGGWHGEAPSLAQLTPRGDLAITVDFRSVYATVLDDWLDADAVQLLNGNHEQLDLFLPPGDVTVPIDPGGDEQVVEWRNGQWVVISESSLGPATQPAPGGPPALGRALAPASPRQPSVPSITVTSELDAYRQGLIDSDTRVRRPATARRHEIRRLVRPLVTP